MFQFQSSSEAKNIPIVFLTATVTKEEVSAQNGVIGGHRFLAKPGSVQELVECIQSNGVLRVQFIFFNDSGIKGVRPQTGHHNHLHVRFQ